MLRLYEADCIPKSVILSPSFGRRTSPDVWGCYAARAAFWPEILF